jgi:callose synthase
MGCSAFTPQKQLFLTALYLLIWGEAANLRFLPECLCYIFHHVMFLKTLIFFDPLNLLTAISAPISSHPGTPGYATFSFAIT